MENFENFLKKQLKKMTEFFQDQQVYEKLRNEYIEVTSGGGLIKVTINKLLEIKDIKIDDCIFNKNDKVLVEKLITEAINSALLEAKAHYTKGWQDIAKAIWEINKE